MKGLILVVALALVHSSFALSWRMLGWTDDTVKTLPDFCHGIECPEFTKVREYEGYELRQYKPVTVVSIRMPMEEFYWEDTTLDSFIFKKLEEYMNGENDRNLTMEMTVPIMKRHLKNKVVMAVMIPKKHAMNPPTPTHPEIEITKIGSENLYVRVVKGWPYSMFGHNYMKDEVEVLKKLLERGGMLSDTKDKFFTVQYDKPTAWFNRHNEVWILKP